MAANANAAMVAMGNGGRGGGMAALGQYGAGLSSLFNAANSSMMGKFDANAQRYTAGQMAVRDRRATAQAVGAARAATAGSGAALDEFAMPVIADIEHRGAHDEAMSILNGENRALQSLTRGRSDAIASVQDTNASLLNAVSFSGWKGAKSSKPAWVGDNSEY